MVDLVTTRCECGLEIKHKPGFVPRCRHRGTIEETDRQKRIRESKERIVRIIGWIQIFANDSDKGVGDTLNRLSQKSKSRELDFVFSELRARYSCCGKEAAMNLNERWPY